MGIEAIKALVTPHKFKPEPLEKRREQLEIEQKEEVLSI